MICSHIAQYSVLYAEKNKINTIYYFDTFTQNSFVVKTLYKASKHWSKNIKVIFNNKILNCYKINLILMLFII